jgi:hypothetical protein
MTAASPVLFIVARRLSYVPACRVARGCIRTARISIKQPPAGVRSLTSAARTRYEQVRVGRRSPQPQTDRSFRRGYSERAARASLGSPQRQSGRQADPHPDGLAHRSAEGCGSCWVASRRPWRIRQRDLSCPAWRGKQKNSRRRRRPPRSPLRRRRAEPNPLGAPQPIFSSSEFTKLLGTRGQLDGNGDGCEGRDREFVDSPL